MRGAGTILQATRAFGFRRGRRWIGPGENGWGDLQTCLERRLQRQFPLRDRCLSGCADLFHDALDKEVEDLQFAVEGLDECLIRLHPPDKLWQHVVPANDVDPAALRNIELTLQLRPEAFIDLAGKPIFDLSVRQRGLDFQEALITDKPVRTTSDRMIVVGDEADPMTVTY
jgi:hypothetical protein